jgi:monoamine oxidase
VLDEMVDWLKSRPAGTDLSFDEYLRAAAIEPRQAKLARAYVEGFNAADASRIGIAALARQQLAEEAIEADRLFHVQGGYDAIPNYLAERSRQDGAVIALGHRVRRVEWTEGSVVVAGMHARGEFACSARRAVITLPLGVLQARDVRFEPLPANILMHADAMAMGSAARISLLFASTWWEDKDLGFLFAAGESIPTWWTPMPNRTPLLTGWAGGPKAAALAHTMAHSLGPQAIEDTALGLLAKFFGASASSVRAELLGAYCHDWQADEFSRGAYSYVPEGALDSSAHLTEPVADTLYFAGEHADLDGHWGTVHAALKSGMRAAEQIRAAPP